MGKLIDKEEAIEALGARPISWTDSDYEIGRQNQYDEDMEAIASVPTMDIVRCKDCRWALGKYCSRFEYCPVTDYDFCSRGERRNDE